MDLRRRVSVDDRNPGIAIDRTSQGTSGRSAAMARSPSAANRRLSADPRLQCREPGAAGHSPESRRHLERGAVRHLRLCRDLRRVPDNRRATGGPVRSAAFVPARRRRLHDCVAAVRRLAVSSLPRRGASSPRPDSDGDGTASARLDPRSVSSGRARARAWLLWSHLRPGEYLWPGTGRRLGFVPTLGLGRRSSSSTCRSA